MDCVVTENAVAPLIAPARPAASIEHATATSHTLSANMRFSFRGVLLMASSEPEPYKLRMVTAGSP